MLCWRRLKGEHTYDVLAKAIDEVLKEFDISDKVVRITTDNGSNFRKAFRIFGVTGAQPSAPRAEPRPAGQCTFDEYDDALEASQVQGITEQERERLLHTASTRETFATPRGEEGSYSARTLNPPFTTG